MRPRHFGSLLLLLFVLAGLTESSAAVRDRGSAVLLNAATGREVAHLSANGAVVAAVADGSGGWFVGGSFSRLAGHDRVAIAHVLPSGAVDPAWRASIGSVSGRPVAVYSLARAGTRLFVGGPFGRVGGLRRPGLAALNSRTGAVLRQWVPRPRAWPDVAALAAAGGRLLVARNYTYPVPGITAIEISTARVDLHWNPRLLLIPDAGNFNTLLPFRDRVYVAGSFRASGLRRNGLVALAASDGRVDRSWAPRVQNCSVCAGFAVLYGLAASAHRVYVSGDFGRINGVARDGIAALNPHSGAVDPHWQPARGGKDILHLRLSGSRLYLGGMSGLRTLDARTGAALRLPRNHAPDEILTLSLSGRQLLVGGRI
jgi:trimeric autotransporter adhesin